LVDLCCLRVDYKQAPNWNTPIAELTTESKRFHCHVYAKLEISNPTGVHKDRESSMIVLDMKEKSMDELACTSTGNAAISISAFAFMNKLRSHVFVGEISEDKLQLIRMFNPEIHKVNGTYLEALRAMLEYINGTNIYNASAGYCQAKLEGNSYIGHEIARDLNPDYVICPTNNGTHFVGVGMGITRAGCRAKMIAATAPHSTVASSITGFYAVEQPKIDNTIKMSDGQLVQIEDDELLESTRSLATQGIFAEPASAASVAALSHINLESSSVVCCTVTGSAFKYPLALQNSLRARI